MFQDCTFEFFSLPYPRLESEFDFVLRIPMQIRTEEALMIAYEISGSFPGYFGRNWDALWDCLCDLSWIVNKTISIVHLDLPLADDRRQQVTYLRILRDAALSWQRRLEQPDDALTPVLPGHDMRVFFPDSLQLHIATALANT
jgi:RNAse (barnase) inhibitor barstar